MRIIEPLKAAPAATRLTFLYCLPAILAISMVLGSYYERTNKVETFIEDQRKWVEDALEDVKNSSLRHPVIMGMNKSQPTYPSTSWLSSCWTIRKFPPTETSYQSLCSKAPGTY